MSMLYLKRKIIRVRFDSKMKNEYKYRSTLVMEVHISVTNMYRESPIFSYPSMVSSTRWPPLIRGAKSYSTTPNSTFFWASSNQDGLDHSSFIKHTPMVQ